MKSKVSGIYLITSKVNGKKYVGQSVDIGQRWRMHLSTLKNNKNPNNHLQNHFNKYSIEDLTFEVLEEVVDLSLLTEREQYYMDLLKPEFNDCPAAGSRIGFKQEGSKYYRYSSKQYQTYYHIQGKMITFSYHHLEDEAIKEVEYIKTLTQEELLNYKEKCLAKPVKLKRNVRHYSFNKLERKYKVQFILEGKNKYFGSYATEQEAIDRVKQLKLELGIE
jgi:group I intron endonuclease